MSNHVSSLLVEVTPGQWFYAMEAHAHQDRWDWLAHAQVAGPFAGETKAADHLAQRFPTYEGSPTVRPFDVTMAQDAEIQALVHRARL